MQDLIAKFTLFLDKNATLFGQICCKKVKLVSLSGTFVVKLIRTCRNTIFANLV